MIISYEKTVDLLCENQFIIKSDRDTPNKLNKIVRPQGIVVQDTWNNFAFPINTVQLDTSKADIARVYQGIKEKYASQPSDLLPWHYVVEMIGSRYYIFNTRPIDQKFPLTSQEVIDMKPNLLSDDAKTFFENRLYDVSNMIHICIIGDSNLDVYPQKLYRLIGRTCIAPLFRDMRIPGSPTTRIFDFNLGKHFRLNTIINFARQ